MDFGFPRAHSSLIGRAGIDNNTIDQGYPLGCSRRARGDQLADIVRRRSPGQDPVKRNDAIGQLIEADREAAVRPAG